jgi:hypothetical protein
VWQRAEPHLPKGPSAGSNREYDDLCRHWNLLLTGLPKLNGWTVTAQLPDIDAAGQAFIDFLELGEPPFSLQNELEEPGRQLDEYRFRLAQVRRKAVADRVHELIVLVDRDVSAIFTALPTEGAERIEDAAVGRVTDAFREFDRLLGDTTPRRGRWSDMARHLHFGQPGDWRDIHEMDWPDVRANLETMGLAELDPIPVASIDLGEAAASHPIGGVSTGLSWSHLDDDQFERILYDLLRGLTNYENVQWLMKTRAPDRGRDISLERVIPDAAGGRRSERVIVQAKHWLAKSIGPLEVRQALASLSLWEPPVVRSLIIATSGRFSADGVGVVERHNADGLRPLVEMWPDSQLEAMLAQRPDVVEAYGLRHHR